MKLSDQPHTRDDYKARVMAAFEVARATAKLTKVEFVLAIKERLPEDEARTITRSTYYNWLDGNGSPRADALLAAADVAGCPVGDLFAGNVSSELARLRQEMTGLRRTIKAMSPPGAATKRR